MSQPSGGGFTRTTPTAPPIHDSPLTAYAFTRTPAHPNCLRELPLATTYMPFTRSHPYYLRRSRELTLTTHALQKVPALGPFTRDPPTARAVHERSPGSSLSVSICFIFVRGRSREESDSHFRISPDALETQGGGAPGASFRDRRFAQRSGWRLCLI
jgi:hypothetical protein